MMNRERELPGKHRKPAYEKSSKALGGANGNETEGMNGFQHLKEEETFMERSRHYREREHSAGRSPRRNRQEEAGGGTSSDRSRGAEGKGEPKGRSDKTGKARGRGPVTAREAKAGLTSGRGSQFTDQKGEGKTWKMAKKRSEWGEEKQGHCERRSGEGA